MLVKYITNVRIPTPRAQGYAVMKMCSEFVKAGVSLELFVPDRANSDIKEDPFDFYGIAQNFKIKRISSFDFLGKITSFGKFFYWIDVLSFFISSKISIKFGNNDILYTRDFLAILFFYKHKNLFLELHDIPKSRILFKWLIKRPNGIFVLNNNIKKEIINLGISQDKVFVSPSGVDISDFDIDITKEDARVKLNLPLDRDIVVYTGHLYDWKGVNTLADSAGFLPDTIFVFVGGVVPEIYEFTKKYEKYKNIIVHPFVGRSIVPIYLKSADILVIPNSAKEKISSQYTSPLKLFEYMASKRPIIVSDLPSMREVLNVDNCIFAEAGNAESFAESIRYLLSDREKCQSISSQAFVDVSQYAWDKRVQNILKYINQNTL